MFSLFGITNAFSVSKNFAQTDILYSKPAAKASSVVINLTRDVSFASGLIPKIFNDDDDNDDEGGEKVASWLVHLVSTPLFVPTGVVPDLHLDVWGLVLEFCPPASRFNLLYTQKSIYKHYRNGLQAVCSVHGGRGRPQKKPRRGPPPHPRGDRRAQTRVERNVKHIRGKEAAANDTSEAAEKIFPPAPPIVHSFTTKEGHIVVLYAPGENQARGRWKIIGNTKTTMKTKTKTKMTSWGGAACARGRCDAKQTTQS